LGKPVVLHTREAEQDTLEMMLQLFPSHWKIHAHCFTDSVDFALRLVQHFPNLYFGFTGVITFKNAGKLLDVVKQVPLNRIVLETDAPFMAPVPFRGQVCHPGM
jgi:TatD DNase family protein